jgi:hypothetical protein
MQASSLVVASPRTASPPSRTPHGSQSRIFAKDKAKAYSTCGMILLDVRTGLVPFTRVVSRERLETKQPAELDLTETLRRADRAAAADALKAAADDMVGFIKSLPRKGG